MHNERENPYGESEHDDVWKGGNSKQVYRWLQYTQNLSIDVGMNSNRRF